MIKKYPSIKPTMKCSQGNMATTICLSLQDKGGNISKEMFICSDKRCKCREIE